MDAVFEFMSSVSGGDNSTLMVSAFVFLSAAALAFGLMAVAQVRFAVKRRAAEISTDTAKAAEDDPRSLRYASKVAAQRLIDYTAKHYSTENKGETKELRRQLLQAGFLDTRAPVLFFLARAVAAVVLALAAFLLMPMLLKPGSAMLWPAGGIGGARGV